MIKQNISLRANTPENYIVGQAIVQAIEENKTQYVICEDFGAALRGTPEQVIKVLISSGINVHAISPGQVFITLNNERSLIRANLYQRPKYCSLFIRIWSDSTQNKDKIKAFLHKALSEHRIKGSVAGMNWAYMTTRGLETSYLEEVFEDTVHEEAYPCVMEQWGSLANFAKAYIEDDSSILILQGPVGTGKSRLIRYLLSKMADDIVQKRTPEEYYEGGEGSAPSLVLYTTDPKVLDSDEIYAKFMHGEERVFVVEDADHVLKPRADGNILLHHFLTISDGIIRNVGRKVVFTTNLSNIGDLDDALIRPGRCFSRLMIKRLTKTQAVGLVNKICPNKEKASTISNRLESTREYSLAEIYKMVK